MRAGAPVRSMTPPRTAPFRATLVLAFVAVLALGLLLGRASAPSSPAGPPTGRAPAPGRSGARSESGVRLGFPESAPGAAAAIAAYQQAFAEPAILRPTVLRARIDAVATPDYAARMLAANGPGSERISVGPIGVGLERGVRTLYREVPIGYRVLSYGSGRADIETWGLTLLGNAGSVEPSAWFGISRTEMVWEGGRWRISDTRSGFGPTPPLATRPGPIGGYDALELAKELRGYVLAP